MQHRIFRRIFVFDQAFVAVPANFNAAKEIGF